MNCCHAISPCSVRRSRTPAAPPHQQSKVAARDESGPPASDVGGHRGDAGLDGEFGLNRRAGSGLILPLKFSPAMVIEKKTSGDSLELMLSGRIDGAAANQLEVEVLAAIKQGVKAIFI